VVEPEHSRHDWGWSLEDELANGGSATVLYGDAVCSESRRETAPVHGLSGSTARNQPARVAVGRRGHVRPVGDEVEQEVGKRSGHRNGRVTEPEEDLVVDAVDVVEAGGGLRGGSDRLRLAAGAAWRTPAPNGRKLRDVWSPLGSLSCCQIARDETIGGPDVQAAHFAPGPSSTARLC